MSDLYMLDTDVASYVIKASHPAIDARLLTLHPDQVCISAITRAELRFGALRLGRPHRLIAEIERFLGGVRAFAWTEQAADRFADIRIKLERRGIPIGVMDTMIAAHAISLDAILVTNNSKHFRRVAGLSVENWSA